MSDSSQEYGKEVLLITVASSIDADLTESQLRAYGIPVLRKFKGSSAYINLYSGATNLGVDIYVPQSAFETAREILSATPEPLEEFEPFDYSQYETDRQKNISKILWAIMIPSCAMILLSILKKLGIL